MSTNSEDAFELSYLVNAVHHRCITGNTYKTNTTKLHSQMYFRDNTNIFHKDKYSTIHTVNTRACIF